MLEEGKLAAMLKGLRSGIRTKNRNDSNPIEVVAHNLVSYINLKGGGHRRYGTGFFVCQVIRHYTRIYIAMLYLQLNVVSHYSIKLFYHA